MVQKVANKPSKSSLIINPATGLSSFGTFPAINSQGAIFLGGPIFLRYGEHYGMGRGWGFEHIWQARFPSAIDQAAAEPLVLGLVCGILVPGASIHYEFGLGSAANRSTVFRSSAGVVVVEERLDGRNDAFYSIVTAFGSRKANGPVIGAI